MAEAAAAGATPLLRNLPDEIVLWEILVRLDPKSLLRCRAVRRDWRRATTNRRFLLAHHARQPALPVIRGEKCNIIAFDYRAAGDAQLHTVARLAKPFVLKASCDGLLLLSKYVYTDSGFRTFLSVCNPATRQHASLTRPLRDFNICGMYPHRPTAEYRLLLQRNDDRVPEGQSGWYVLALGSDQPPRDLGCSEIKVVSPCAAPVRVRDCLHWYPVYCETEIDLVIVFDTIAESFRRMRAPLVDGISFIFEMGDMLGIYSLNKATKVVDIWVLQNYESEFWDFKYRVKLPMADIRGELLGFHVDRDWFVTVISGDGDVLLLVSFAHWLFYVDTDGVLVASFYDLKASRYRLKQTLVLHDFFTTLEGYAVEASPFI